jgi:hypothetical protein
VSRGNRAEGIAVAKVQHAKPRLAYARRVFEHGIKDWLKLARRTADDFQHLRGRRLLLQRLA